MKKRIFLLTSLMVTGLFVACGGSDDNTPGLSEEKLEGRWYVHSLKAVLSSTGQEFIEEFEDECDRKQGPKFNLDRTGVSYDTDEDSNGNCIESTTPFAYNVLDNKLVINMEGESITFIAKIEKDRLKLTNKEDVDEDGILEEVETILKKTLN